VKAQLDTPPFGVWPRRLPGLYDFNEMKSLLAVAVIMTLLLPGLAAALVCTSADCPMIDCGGARAHDCCPPAPVTVSRDCCEQAPPARTVAPEFPERSPSTIAAFSSGSTAGLVVSTAVSSFLPDWREPRPPLDCLARTCVLRN
jgi:hypothetical protein